MKFLPPDFDLTGDYSEDVVLSAMLSKPKASVQYFWIPGEPIPNARARTVCKHGKTWSFTPKTTIHAKNRIYAAVMNQGPVRFPPPFSVAIKFICQRLKTIYEQYPVAPSHGDCDNLQKLCLDALFSDKKTMPPFPFPDDRYITDCFTFKRFPNPGEEPGIKLWLIK